MISRTKPEFWELYRALPAEIQIAARSAYEKFFRILRIRACNWKDCGAIDAHGP